MELEEALERHGVAPEAAVAFRRLLDAWAREPDPQTTVPPDEAVDVHIADSLAGLSFPELREARTIADVGAGAGFPGLAMAIALPAARVDLIESAGRKVAVIERLAVAAEIRNALAVRARAEEWSAAEARGIYDVACARAVGPLPVLLEYAAPLLRDGGALIAWKGRRDAAEEAAGDEVARLLGLARAEIRPVEPYPGSRDRHLHLYRKLRPTPDGFPRRPGLAAKRPLA
jgi:16S rRNA (guanine527-N7)-methyltransferase